MHKISFWGQTKLYHISQKTFGHTCTIFSCTLQILYLSTKRHIQKNIKVPVGMRHRSYPWKHLQPSTSIFKYSPTSRKLVLIFCQMQLHLHMDLTIPLSLDLCLFFCNKTGPITGKEKWDGYLRFQLDTGWIVLLHDTSPASWEPTKKEGSISFSFLLHTGALLLLVCLSACIVLMSYGFFFNLSIMLFTLLWWEDRKICAHFRRGTVLCKSCFPCQAQVWMWRFLAAPLASCITRIDCFLFLISQ